MLTVLSWPFVDKQRIVKILSCLMNKFPADVKQNGTMKHSFCFSSHTANKCPFVVYLMPCFCIFVLFVGIENPRDGEAWWAAVCGVAQSRTRLKRLSSSSSSK